MKSNYNFSRNQLLALCSVSFLSPALRLFPASSAALAGRASWLAPLAALPLMLAYIYFLSKLMDKAEGSEGLAELSMRVFGDNWGRLYLGLFSLWYLFYGAFVLRTGADRLITTVYPYTSPRIFVVTMGLLSLFAALCPVRSIVRTAKLVMPIVLGFLLLMLLFSFFSIDKSNLLPIAIDDTVPVLKASVTALNVTVGVMYSICFLGGMVKKEPGRFSAYVRWICFASFLLSLICLCIVGCFGPELTAKLTRPFFSLVRSLVFFSSIERMEALMVTLWIFPDFLLVSLVLCCAQHCLRLIIGAEFQNEPPRIFELRYGRWIIWLCSIAVILLGMFMAPGSTGLEFLSKKLVPYANLSFAFLFVPLVFIWGRIKNKL